VDKKQRLDEIAAKVMGCRKCPLFQNTTHGVPGEGDPDAKIMFIGEGPGFHEDQEGRPFVGQAGKLLDKLIESIGLKRTEVFIGNVVKHRPPGNRDPLPDEIEACKEYLDGQIKIIDPEIIVTLGRFSMNKFLPGEYISKTHGQARFVEIFGKRCIVIPMYHPAAALRSSQVMEELKTDFMKIKKFLEKEELIEKEKQDSQLSLIN